MEIMAPGRRASRTVFALERVTSDTLKRRSGRHGWCVQGDPPSWVTWASSWYSCTEPVLGFGRNGGRVGHAMLGCALRDRCKMFGINAVTLLKTRRCPLRLRPSGERRISQPVSSWEFTLTDSKAAPVPFPERSLCTRNEARSLSTTVDSVFAANEAPGSLVSSRTKVVCWVRKPEQR